ncbi:MAG: hypothetical protein BHW58_04485 [Azospirillum sp. 51_20]|nr:MAG: hypothetical protein BHW58_04485 [Azospirillum sp. 51_20]
MYLADYHVHSSCSPDGHVTMADMARTGIGRGLSEICFTDHVEPILLGSGALRDHYDWAALAAEYAAARKEEQIRRDNLASITMEKVGQYVREGKTVIVTVSADWCLTCRFNDIMVFENPAIKQKIQNRGVVMLNVDWTVSNSETAEFMKKFGRSGLPFYVLFSPLVPDGMVLPEILSEQELKLLIDNMSLFRPNS